MQADRTQTAIKRRSGGDQTAIKSRSNADQVATKNGADHPLRQARRDCDGMTQQQLADAAEVDRGTIIRVEAYAVEPLVSTALRLARAVGRSVEDLWGGKH